MLKNSGSFCPNSSVSQRCSRLRLCLLLPRLLSWSVRVRVRTCSSGVWTSAFVATSVRARRPCRQGRSPETDAPGVCSSFPPRSSHTHPSGSTPLPLSFRTHRLLSERGAHWDFLKILIWIHPSKCVCVSVLGPTACLMCVSIYVEMLWQQRLLVVTASTADESPGTSSFFATLRRASSCVKRCL